MVLWYIMIREYHEWYYAMLGQRGNTKINALWYFDVMIREYQKWYYDVSWQRRIRNDIMIDCIRHCFMVCHDKWVVEMVLC